MTFPENPFCTTYSGNFDPKQARVTKERKERYWGWVFSFIILGLAGSLQAQTQDTLMLDSTAVRVEKVNAGDSIAGEIHSPRKASIYSAVLPGLGQVYNKKYWKLPIVYGVIGTVLYFVVSNGQKLRQFNGYISNVYDSIDNPSPYNTLDLSELETYRNTYRKNVQLASFGTVFAWGLSIVDAVVDAHLHSFDISDKLALKIKPQINYSNFTYYTGIGVNLTFK